MGLIQPTAKHGMALNTITCISIFVRRCKKLIGKQKTTPYQHTLQHTTGSCPLAMVLKQHFPATLYTHEQGAVPNHGAEHPPDKELSLTMVLKHVPATLHTTDGQL